MLEWRFAVFRMWSAEEAAWDAGQKKKELDAKLEAEGFMPHGDEIPTIQEWEAEWKGSEW